MLSAFSKKKLIKLLLKLYEAENHAESLRQILCKQDEFEPYMVFKNIQNEQGLINTLDVYNLLQKNGMIVQPEQIQPVIEWYSQKCNDKLTYQDFMQIVLPQSNLELRKLVTQKETYSKKLSYEIEYALCRVFYKEVQIQDELLNSKQDLLSQPDFSYRIAFETIDQFGSGFIQEDMLQHFIQQDCKLLIRRLDQNRDSQIDLEDFRRALRVEQLQGMMKTSQSNSINKQTQQQVYVLQENQFPNRRAKQSIQKHINRNRKDSQPKQNNIQDLDYLAETFRIISDLEHENEIKKEELSYLQFDLLELFLYFDADRTGKLTPGDVKSVLEDLQIYPTQSQLFLWMKRYDSDRDGKWSVKEFMFAFKSINHQKINDRKMDAEILEAIKQLIRTEIENEVAIECVRQKLAKKPNFNLKNLFGAITQRQVINEHELRTFLENHGIYLEDRQRQLLLRRFDKMEQNYITYGDFLNELYPKQGKR